MHRFTRFPRMVVRTCAVVGASLWVAQPAQAATARRFGQPISAYSASLFGKTNLSATQTQTLTADPDEPLGGSTSGTFDPSIVRVTGFGYGPGYEVPEAPRIELTGGTQVVVPPSQASPFPSGFGIEVVEPDSPNGAVLIDMQSYLSNPFAFNPTGYFRVYFAIGAEGVGATGKLTHDPSFLDSHPGYIPLGNDGPLGVDTHFLDFAYRDTNNSVPAPYSIFAQEANKHYVLGDGFTLLNSDFVVMQDSPREEIRPGGDVPFQSASVSGTVPEPSTLTAAALVVLAGATGRRREH